MALKRLVQDIRQFGLGMLWRRLIPAVVRVRVRTFGAGLSDWRKRALISAGKDELQRILQEHSNARQIVLFPPGLRWQTQLFQRPQQLARALARSGALIFYAQAGRGLTPGVQRLEPNLYLGNLPAAAFEVLPDPLLYVLTWNRAHLERYPGQRVWYDFVDHLQVFHYPDHQELEREHLRLVHNSELVTVTSQALFESIVEMRPDALYCPNAVDLDHFQQVGSELSEPPADLLPVLEMGLPVIGYYGALARWLDYAMLAELAGLRPDLSFLLIGPDYDGSLKKSNSAALENVHWLGARNYDDLPRYLRWFDVAMIPFVVSAETEAVSPLKLFEYLAGGKPVVATMMRECLRYPVVLTAKDAKDFSLQLDRGLDLIHDGNYMERIQQTARENTWAQRAAKVLEALNSPWNEPQHPPR